MFNPPGTVTTRTVLAVTDRYQPWSAPPSEQVATTNAGSIQLRGIIDGNNNIAETDEDNNIVLSSFFSVRARLHARIDAGGCAYDSAVYSPHSQLLAGKMPRSTATLLLSRLVPPVLPPQTATDVAPTSIAPATPTINNTNPVDVTFVIQNLGFFIAIVPDPAAK